MKTTGSVIRKTALLLNIMLLFGGLCRAQSNDSLMTVAKSLYGDGDYAGAAAVLREVVASDGDNGVAQRYLGYALQGLGKHTEAVPHLLEAVKADSGDVRLLSALGRSYEAMGLPEKAEEVYHDCLRMDSRNRTALQRILQLCFDKKDWNSAAYYAGRLVRLDPENAVNLLHLGLAEMNRGNLEAAASALQHGQRVSPENLDITLTLSSVYLQMDLLESALRILTTGASYHPTQHRLFRRIGDIYFKQHIFNRADSCFSRAVVLGDSSAATLRLLGAAEILQDKVPEAHEHLGLSFEKDSTDPLTPYYLGLTLEKEDSLSAAIRWLGKSIELSDAVFIGQVLSQMSTVHEQSGNLTAAVQDLKKAISISTNKSRLYFQLASLYDRHYADPSTAATYYQEFVQQAAESDSLLVGHAVRRLRILKEKGHFFRK